MNEQQIREDERLKVLRLIEEMIPSEDELGRTVKEGRLMDAAELQGRQEALEALKEKLK
jgi:aromatic ring hydroxylase